MNEKKQAIRDEYDRTASIYDQNWSYYIKSTSVETLQRMEMSPGDRLLDVGCGTGYFLNLLRSSGFSGRTVGLDLSLEMIKRGKRNDRGGASFLAGQSEFLPFREDSLTTVVSNNAFHFFLEPELFLREVRRVLVEGGRLYITDWDDEFWACWLCDYYLWWTDSAHTKVYGSEELRDLMEAEPFRVDFIDCYKIDWLWGLMTLKATHTNDDP